jgi:hypothetical protein
VSKSVTTDTEVRDRCDNRYCMPAALCGASCSMYPGIMESLIGRIHGGLIFVDSLFHASVDLFHTSIPFGVERHALAFWTTEAWQGKCRMMALHTKRNCSHPAVY